MKVNTKEIPHTITYQIIPLFLQFRGDVLHTSMLGGVHEVDKVTAVRGVFQVW